jgi:hypothetical protein
VADAAVALVLSAADEDCRVAARALFPGADLRSLEREELRSPEPFTGPLFGLLATLPRGCVLGLVVPASPAPTEAPGAAGRSPCPGDLVPVADHVGLEPCGPLSGRWPAGEPRDFPSVTGIYQPAIVRRPEGARVYSSGVVAAGVADARRLTRFEVRAVREGGWPIVSDSLVPVAIVAAYYGMRLAACALVQAPTDDRE